MPNGIQKYEQPELQRGVIARQEFTGQQAQAQSETASSAVAAREQAVTNARFIMAERHPRSWDTVRVRVLQHCDRPGFAEVARYKKPAGKKQINGQWVESFAEGLSARFAEVARQEMGNTIAESSVVYEDDLIRIVRASVTDLERNNTEAREITVAKVQEKRGKQNGRSGEWEPPAGREVMSSRINTYGDPVYLCRATDDETRNKQNSEISKTHRDCSLRLIPKDIRDDAEERILATIADPKKTDPAAARKRIIDAFAKLGVIPEDLIAYIGCPLDRISPAQLDELRGLHTAVKDGETTFNDALRAKYDTAQKDGEDETTAQHDARLQKQMEEQVKESPMTPTVSGTVKSGADDALSADELAELSRRDAEEAKREQTPRPKPAFGGKK